jgi:DNA-binding MarR family transcriptional regulator
MTRATERAVWEALRTLVVDRDDSKREAVAALDMSFGRIKTLRFVASGPVPMRDLVAALGSDAAYTTVLVDDLERRGFVTRQPHPDDRRAKLVSVTAAGRRAARKADAILGRPPATLARLSDADLAELARLVTLLAE